MKTLKSCLICWRRTRLTPAQLAAMLGETEEDVAAAINAYEEFDDPRPRPWSIGIKHPRRA